MEHMRETLHVNSVDICQADTDETGCRYSVGPLDINRAAKKAGTVMGAELILDENEFDILDMLASREGEYVTFDELYKANWKLSESHDGKETARTAIDELIKKVSFDGCGFMWIDYSPEAGYIFKTRWGNNWNPQSEISTIEPAKGASEDDTTPVKVIIRRRSRSAEYIAGVSAIAAAIILMLLFLFNTLILKPPDVEPLFKIVEDTSIPLAQPDIEDTG